MNLQMFKLDLEKAEGPEIKLPISVGSSKKQESSRKTSFASSLTPPESLTCGSSQTVENSSRYGKLDHFIWLLRNLHAGQRATVRAGHGKTDLIQIGKGV